MLKNDRKIIIALPALIAALAVIFVMQRDEERSVAPANLNAAPPISEEEMVPPEENEPIPTSSPRLFLYNFDGSAKIKSPLTVTGFASGWYFEGSFPVRLLDDKGTVLAQAPAMALDDWMTVKFVPFKVKLDFAAPASGKGTLILQKDNPSGDPAFDEAVEIPVVFAGAEESDCRPTGCSGQICSDHGVVSTCEYRDEYACYQTAKCERQSDGECGWTETAELAACLAGAR